MKNITIYIILFTLLGLALVHARLSLGVSIYNLQQCQRENNTEMPVWDCVDQQEPSYKTAFWIMKEYLHLNR